MGGDDGVRSCYTLLVYWRSTTCGSQMRGVKGQGGWSHCLSTMKVLTHRLCGCAAVREPPACAEREGRCGI